MRIEREMPESIHSIGIETTSPTMEKIEQVATTQIVDMNTDCSSAFVELQEPEDDFVQEKLSGVGRPRSLTPEQIELVFNEMKSGELTNNEIIDKLQLPVVSKTLTRIRKKMVEEGRLLDSRKQRAKSVLKPTVVEEIARLTLEGKRQSEIAATLGLSARGVKRGKFLARKRGLLPPTENTPSNIKKR